MAFEKKTWKDRLVEFPGRRLLKRISGSADGELVVDVARQEGIISQDGDAFSAANMNDLEQRVADEFGELNDKLNSRPDWIYDADGKIVGYKTKDGADTVFPFLDLTWGEGSCAGKTTVYTPSKPQIIIGLLPAFGYGCYYININDGMQSAGWTFDNWLQVYDDHFIIGVNGTAWYYKYAY